MPFVLIGMTQKRRNPARLFLAGVAIMLGGVCCVLNGFLIGYDTGVGDWLDLLPVVCRDHGHHRHVRD